MKKNMDDFVKDLTEELTGFQCMFSNLDKWLLEKTKEADRKGLKKECRVFEEVYKKLHQFNGER